MNEKLTILVLVLISIFSFNLILRPGYFPMHDDMQAMRVLQLHKCVLDAQLPCRWVPDMGYGYGYPQFIFYSPLPYYVMEGFHLSGLSILDSVKAGFALSFILSAFSMFLLGRSLWGNFGGFLSSVFYVYAPYRASDVYTRGAVGEFWALAFMPLILWAILELVRQEKAKYLVYLILSYGVLLVTHNISSVAFSLPAAAWGVFLLWYFKKWRLFPKLVLGAIGGVSLAAFYALPVIFEKKYVHIESLTSGYFDYRAHFVSLRQMFFSTHWGFGSSWLGPYDDLSFSIGIFHWLFALLSLILAFMLRKKDKFLFMASLFFAAFSLGSLFMAHQKSIFIWSRIPLLAFFQFPWRFLTLATLGVSVLAGYFVSPLRGLATKSYLILAMIILVFFTNVFYFRPREWFDITDEDKFSGELWQRQLTISIFDYLPIFAELPPAEQAPAMPILVDGAGQIKEFEKGTDWQKGVLLVDSQEATIRLPLYYFPGFKVWLDGEDTKISYENELGLITFTVPKGEHSFYVKLKRTPVRAAADALTGIITLAILAWFIKESRVKSLYVKR